MNNHRLTRRAAWVVVALVGVVAVAACGRAVPVGQGTDDSGADGRVDVAVDRIAYVTDDGDLFTINADGTGQLKLTGTSQISSSALSAILAQPAERDHLYTWPTWSPDGEKIAASHIQVRQGQAIVSVEVIEVSTGQARTVFTDDSPSLVAQGAPHYLYWSPDSSSLAVLAGSTDGLALHVVDVTSAAPPVLVATGAPLYFHWSRDSQSLALHVGDDLLLARKPFMAPMPVLQSGLTAFRAPAISPDSRTVAYAASSGVGNSLIIAPVFSPDEARELAEVGELAAFAWSPSGNELAVADSREARSGGFERLRVVSSDGATTRTVTEDTIVAFYWSPTGDGLAWVDLDSSGARARWQVERGESSPAVALTAFQPSADMGIMLWFFDQYGYSHSPWSPDGQSLVFAGRQQVRAGSVNGHSPSGDRVFVVNVDGSTPARELTSGKLAFWSWN